MFSDSGFACYCCSGTVMAWHLVKGMAGPGSTGAGGSLVLPVWPGADPGSTHPWVHLRASLQSEDIIWIKATSWEGVFFSQRLWSSIGRVIIFLSRTIGIPNDTLPAITNSFSITNARSSFREANQEGEKLRYRIFWTEGCISTQSALYILRFVGF